MYSENDTEFMMEGAIRELTETSKFFREGYRVQHDVDEQVKIARNREQTIRLAMGALESRIRDLMIENKLLAITAETAETAKVAAVYDARKWCIFYWRQTRRLTKCKEKSND